MSLRCIVCSVCVIHDSMQRRRRTKLSITMTMMETMSKACLVALSHDQYVTLRHHACRPTASCICVILSVVILQNHATTQTTTSQQRRNDVLGCLISVHGSPKSCASEPPHIYSPPSYSSQREQDIRTILEPPTLLVIPDEKLKLGPQLF
jgi:hypothetical protein